MVEVSSNMLPLGTQAPSWTLPDTVSGKELSLAELASAKATVIMFICNHCPFVKLLQEQLVALARDYQPQEVSIIAISSNDVETHPADSPEKMKEEAERYGYSFPYLYDESQDVARAYQAACTPDFYVFAGNLACAYRGQFDSARPGNGIAPSGADIRAVLDALLAGEEVDSAQTPSSGCNIKWKTA